MSEPALIGTTTLMRRAFAGENLEATARVLLERIRINPGDANAAMDLSILFELGGDSLLAMEFQASALSQQSLFREKESLSPTLKVLAIKSRGVIMDNMPLGFLLENSTVQLESLYVGLGIQAPGEIPDHDVAIVAICESDMNQDLLADLASVVAQWPRPVVNDPVHIANLSRDRLGKVVENIDGLVFASSTRWQRHELESLDAGPQRSKLGTSVAGWIIRPTNSHAGHGLEHIAMEQSFSPYLERTSGDDFLIAPFVPYASADGIYRKYRIALIQGESFPVHMALSTRWMVHYLNADMLSNPDHRNEESEFFSNYQNGFGSRHRRTLESLSQHIGLDYVVLDCAETCDGELLLFEADNGAVVHAMDPVELFPYKRPAMQNIFDAFEKLLVSKTKRTGISLAA